MLEIENKQTKNTWLQFKAACSKLFGKWLFVGRCIHGGKNIKVILFASNYGETCLGLWYLLFKPRFLISKMAFHPFLLNCTNVSTSHIKPSKYDSNFFWYQNLHLSEEKCCGWGWWSKQAPLRILRTLFLIFYNFETGFIAD